MPLLVMISIFSVLAGISQGVCGFGAGVILMVLLPHFYPISQSAAVTGNKPCPHHSHVHPLQKACPH